MLLKKKTNIAYKGRWGGNNKYTPMQAIELSMVDYRFGGVRRASVTHSIIDIFCSSVHLCLKTSAPLMNWLSQKPQIIAAFETFSARL